MLTEVLYISLTGIGVVFSFLFVIFLLLKGLKFFAVEEEKSKKIKKNKKFREGDISPELVAAIIAALNEEELLTGEKIIICKKTGGV